MFKCQNGIDYDECNNKTKEKGELCDECASIAYDKATEQAASDYFGGSQPYTMRERSEAIFNELLALGVK